MSHTSGQLSNGGQFAGLNQLGLRLLQAYFCLLNFLIETGVAQSYAELQSEQRQ